MKKNKSISSKIFSWIFIIVMLVAIYKLFGIFRENFFNGFIKAEATLGLSEFRRDSNVKYSENNSYKIKSTVFNDATFYKEVEVKPNTAYKVTCMVKTEDVVPQEIKQWLWSAIFKLLIISGLFLFNSSSFINVVL